MKSWQTDDTHSILTSLLLLARNSNDEEMEFTTLQTLAYIVKNGNGLQMGDGIGERMD